MTSTMDKGGPEDTNPKNVKARPEKKKDGLWETVKIVIEALLLALIVTTFVFRLFSIPSASMRATLLEGDYVFVTKYAYGYSEHSFPWGIIQFDGRVFPGVPRRGDVIVFKTPADDSTDFIKRVIGLPGDTIEVRAGVLYIDGNEVPREPLGEVVTMGTDGFGGPETVTATRYRETLPNGASYEVLDTGYTPRTYPADDFGPVTVPAGTVFVMGDNRDNSADSRFDVVRGNPNSGVGFVPFDNIVGRAEFIIFSIDDARPWEIWKWPTAVRWDRMFDGL